MLSGNTINCFVAILIVYKLNKNQLYVHLSEINDESFEGSKEDKALKHK